MDFYGRYMGGVDPVEGERPYDMMLTEPAPDYSISFNSMGPDWTAEHALADVWVLQRSSTVTISEGGYNGFCAQNQSYLSQMGFASDHPFGEGLHHIFTSSNPMEYHAEFPHTTSAGTCFL
jgi:hypothetical protein